MTNKKYTIYDRNTGATGGHIGCSIHHRNLMAADPDTVVIEGEYARTHWWNPATESLEPLTDMGTTISSETITLGQTVTISNIPAGTTVTSGNDVFTVDDGVLNTTPQTVGKFGYSLSHPAHFATSYLVECND